MVQMSLQMMFGLWPCQIVTIGLLYFSLKSAM